MPVFIHQPDALDLMGRVEGERWRRLQDSQPESPYGFHRYLTAWNEIVSEGYQGEVRPSELVDGGDGAIYGDGGVSRYAVDARGSIILLRWSTNPTRIKLAESLGFDIS